MRCFVVITLLIACLANVTKAENCDYLLDVNSIYDEISNKKASISKIRQLQKYVGTAQDGQWGPQSEKAYAALLRMCGNPISSGKGREEFESKGANQGNSNWHPSIKTELHNTDITRASFQYVDEVLEHALALFKLDEVPNAGLNVIGESIDTDMEIPAVDCVKYLKNMASAFPKRHDDPAQVQRCNYFYRTNFFNGGREVFQEVLDHWAEQGHKVYNINYKSGDPSSSMAENANDIYSRQVTVAQISTTYALLYNHFNNHQAINEFLINWSLENQSNTKTGVPHCPFDNPPSFAKNYLKNPYKRDGCGSNVWRGSVAKIALGLQLNNNDLFIAGVKQFEINMSMYDENGIFVPYANRGWDSPGYAADNDEFINAIAIMLEDLGVDLYQVRVKDQTTVAELMRGHREWLNDPKKAQHYILGTLTSNGGVSVAFKNFKQAGPLDKWKEDKAFDEVELNLRVFHFLAKNADDKVLLNAISSKNAVSGLPVNHAWGQKSGFPVILATLSRRNLLRSWLDKISEPFTGDVDQDDLLKGSKPLKGEFTCSVQIRRYLQNESGISARSQIQIKNGRIQFLETEWSTGDQTADRNLLRKNAKLIITDGMKLNGYLPVYIWVGGPDQKTLVLREELVQTNKSKSPNGEVRVKIRDGLEFGIEISKCIIDQVQEDQASKDDYESIASDTRLQVVDLKKFEPMLGDFRCFVEFRRYSKDEVKILGTSEIYFSDGNVKFFDTDWRAGGSKADPQLLNKQSNLRLTKNRILKGSFPIYTMHGSSKKVTVGLTDEFIPFEQSNLPTGYGKIQLDNSLSVRLDVKNCTGSSETIVSTKTQNGDGASSKADIENASLKTGEIELLAGQHTCSLDINRTLKPQNDVGKIFESEVYINAGRLSFEEFEWRTGGGVVGLNAIKGSSLSITSAGDLVGEMPVYVMFGNDELVTVTLPSTLDKRNSIDIPEGKHTIIVRDGLELEFVVSNCEK